MLASIFGVVAVRFLYLALHLESSSFPHPLPAHREIEAFERLAQGDQTAKELLIRHNLRLVAHVAKKYYSAPADQEDLISIGTIGLIKAVNSFDHKKGARFATYAARCIENEILMHFRAERKNTGLISLQEPVEAGRDSGTLTILDTLQDDFVLNEDLELREEIRRLRGLVERLQGRERQVILLRYGMAGQPPMTQNEVAAVLGVSRSYISRLEKRAVEMLRSQMEAPVQKE